MIGKALSPSVKIRSADGGLDFLSVARVLFVLDPFTVLPFLNCASAGALEVASRGAVVFTPQLPPPLTVPFSS